MEILKGMLKHILCTGLLLVFSFGHALGLEPKVFSMEDSVQYALENNPELQGLDITVQQAEEQIKSARGYFFPTITGSYSHSLIDSIHESGPVDTDYVDQKKISGSARLTQVLFSGYKYISRYKKAKLGKEHQEGKAAVRRLELANQVRASFLELLKARYDISVYAQAVKRLETDCDTARALSRRKLLDRSLLLQAEADLELARQRQWEAKTEVFKYEERLNRLLGIPAPEPANAGVKYEGQFDTPQNPMTLSMRQCVDIGMEKRIEPGLIRLEIKMAEKEAKAAMSDYYPTISLNTGYYDVDTDYGSDGIDSDGFTYDPDRRNQYWQTSIQVNWQFYDGGTKYHEAMSQKLGISKLKKDLAQVGMEIAEEVRVEYRLFSENENRITASLKAIDAARERYRAEQKRLTAKLSTVSKVLDAQTRLVRSEAMYSQALLDYKLSQIRLNHAMGMGEINQITE